MSKCNRYWAAMVVVAVLLVGCVNAPGMGPFATQSVDVRNWGQPVTSSDDGDIWYYQEIEGTQCANGTPTGVGVSDGPAQRDLVIYMSGGGACWNSMRCSYFQLAANLDVTYDAGQLGKELYPLMNAGLLDRQAAVNPLKHANYAYIPYCTGDLHAGRKITEYGGYMGDKEVHHVGAHNLDLILNRLPEIFPHVERLWLVGISAGGYGITLNFDRFLEAYPGAEVHVFTDASPWLSVDPDRWEIWQRNWDPQLPKDCERCVGEPEYLVEYLARRYPETRFAMTIYARDPVLSAYIGTFPGGVEKAVDEFVEQRYSHPNTRAFVADGRDHEMLLHLDDGVRSRDGQRLSEFYRHWVAGW